MFTCQLTQLVSVRDTFEPIFDFVCNLSSPGRRIFSVIGSSKQLLFQYSSQNVLRLTLPKPAAGSKTSDLAQA